MNENKQDRGDYIVFFLHEDIDQIENYIHTYWQPMYFKDLNEVLKHLQENLFNEDGPLFYETIEEYKEKVWDIIIAKAV